jgi:hypothetical protein
MIPRFYGFLRGSLQILIQLGKLLSTRSAGGSGPFRLFQILSSAGFFTARGRGLGVRLEKNGIPGPPSRLHLPMILPSWSLPSFWAGICAFKKFFGASRANIGRLFTRCGNFSSPSCMQRGIPGDLLPARLSPQGLALAVRAGHRKCPPHMFCKVLRQTSSTRWFHLEPKVCRLCK